MNLLWMDVETTGLIPKKHEIIDIALIETDRSGQILNTFNCKIKPIYGCDLEAAKVNGYTKEKWENAFSLYEVLDLINSTFSKDKKIPAGWNITFDLSFINNLNWGIPLTHHSLDLYSLAWFSYLQKQDKKINLELLCNLMNIPYLNAHTALGDVILYLEIYQGLKNGG